MPKICIFCGEGGPFTAEHVLPEWIADLLKIQRVSITPSRMGQPLKPWFAVGSFGSTVKRVCEACNNGWMSDLESDAKPILSRMILPTEPVLLSPDAQMIVAAWLWKLAIVFEHQSGATYFTVDERRLLIDGNPPPSGGVRIWIAGHRGAKNPKDEPRFNANIVGGPSTFSLPDGRSVPGFQMTFFVRRFAAQVLCVRPLPGTKMNFKFQYDFTTAEISIWPEESVHVAWPPAGGLLDEEQFEKWHTRAFDPAFRT